MITKHFYFKKMEENLLLKSINEAIEACDRLVRHGKCHERVLDKYPGFDIRGFNPSSIEEVRGIFHFFQYHANVFLHCWEARRDFRIFDGLCENKVVKTKIILHCTRKYIRETSKDTKKTLDFKVAELKVRACGYELESATLSLESAKLREAIPEELVVKESIVALCKAKVIAAKSEFESCKTALRLAEDILPVPEEEKNTLVSEIEAVLVNNTL